MTTNASSAKTLRRLSPGSSNSVRLVGALIVQHGRPMLMTAAIAQDVVRQTSVDVYNPQTEEGYQRDLSRPRVLGAARYYQEEKGRMPNPLLINIRDEDSSKIQIEVTEGSREAFDEAQDNEENWIGAGYIDIPRDLKCWVYDGQHRVAGVAEILQGDDHFADFPIPLSITLGLATSEEMKEFYEVNTNAKSVRTDLAQELLRKMVENDPALSAKLSGTKDLQLRGLEVIKVLTTLDGPWAGRIQAPLQKRVGSDKLTIPQPQFVLSLKPVLDMPLFERADPATIAQIINAFWKGVAEVLPEPFAPENNPKDWALQKGQGTVSLHRVLPRVVEVVRARGQRLGDGHAYAVVLENLKLLSGTGTDEETGEQVEVSGSDFWLSGNKGQASAFSGEAGRRRLAIMIQALLPKPAEEITL